MESLPRGRADRRAQHPRLFTGRQAHRYVYRRRPGVGASALPFLGGEGVASITYWAKKAVPKWDYGNLFLIGTFLGALGSALVSGSFRFGSVPTVWSDRYGPSVPKRMIAAFIGGIVIIYGARLADGCTSGHGISGSLQLAVSSWTFFIMMFVSGIATAFALFGRSSKA